MESDHLAEPLGSNRKQEDGRNSPLLIDDESEGETLSEEFLCKFSRNFTTLVSEAGEDKYGHAARYALYPVYRRRANATADDLSYSYRRRCVQLGVLVCPPLIGHLPATLSVVSSSMALRPRTSSFGLYALLPPHGIRFLACSSKDPKMPSPNQCGNY